MTDSSSPDSTLTGTGVMTTHSATGELIISRVFAASRETVFQAFTDPELLVRWFGPVGFSVPPDTVDLDVRPGGHQRFMMVKDDNPTMTSPMDGRFTQVIENELLVGSEEFIGVPGVQEPTTMALRFEFHDADGGGTKVVIQQGPFMPELEQSAKAGWESSFSKLDALLAA